MSENKNGKGSKVEFTFRRGVVKKVAELLGLNSVQAAYNRIQNHDPEALELAVKIDLEIKKKQQKAIDMYRKAKEFEVV